MSSKGANKYLSVSVLVGTLLVPISALAAVWLTDSNTSADTIPGATQPAPETVTASTLVPVSSDPADLKAACGPDGMKLVDLEADRAITDVQQAALDALRPLCAEEGLALPAAPTTEPVVRTVVTPAPITAQATTTVTTDDHSDDHDEEYEEDDDHREHEEHHEEEDD